MLESAPFNKDKTKVYSGVPGNLVAFISKSQLIDHYVETLGAIHFGGRLMIIDSKAALKLVYKYFSNLIE